ncbi:MAG TPA: hypothetical protein VGL15_02035 [Vicinamibacteria bacterium]
MADSDARAPKDEHFSEEDWVDFARQRGDPDHRAGVARHLETGCPQCAQTLRVWGAMLSVAEQEAAYTPPEQAILQAKRLFSIDQPKGLRERAAAHIAVVFDSFRQPLPAGVRAAGTLPRYLLYKAGRYAIRVQVDPADASRSWSIVGQILDELEPTRALRDIAVRAMQGARTLDRTLTNQLGEFHLEPRATDTFQLSFGVPEIGTFTVQPPVSAEKAARGAAGRTAEGGRRGKKARGR